MQEHPSSCVLVRKLSSSDLGWFAAPRDSGRVASKQRAININATIVNNVLPKRDTLSGGLFLKAKCVHPACTDERERILSKVGKNWRLGGPKVPGDVFGQIEEGDVFVCEIDLRGTSPYPCKWTVVMRSESPSVHTEVLKAYEPHFQDRMCFLSELPSTEGILRPLLGAPPHARSPSKAPGVRRKEKRKLTVQERLQQPHILQEMIRTALSLSAQAQQDFLAMLERVGSVVRDLLLSEGLIHSIEIDHNALWSEVAGQALAFVDGGMASIGSLGAEPIAIRVGSYVVVPGRTDADRESFTMEKQLVDELFESTPGHGLFDDLFDDVGKLRDAARISVETAGALTSLAHRLQPTHLFVHGSLVNPVSPYALDGFPDFTEAGIKSLLPCEEWGRTGRSRNFVSVYLRQLELLKNASATVCGVVERASQSAMVIKSLLDHLKTTDSSPGASVLEQLWERICDYRLTDAVLFHAILNEGEYVSPVEVDRNDLARAPNMWKEAIAKYPRPWVTYVGMGEMVSPLRCEFFAEPAQGYDLPIRIIIHSCRLMPKYAFPAGLDIVDKFAKVPNWMSRPINNMLAVQVLKKALDSGNPALIAEAKRLVCGNTRDWMFRPTYQR